GWARWRRKRKRAFEFPIPQDEDDSATGWRGAVVLRGPRSRRCARAEPQASGLPGLLAVSPLVAAVPPTGQALRAGRRRRRPGRPEWAATRGSCGGGRGRFGRILELLPGDGRQLVLGRSLPASRYWQIQWYALLRLERDQPAACSSGWIATP